MKVRGSSLRSRARLAYSLLAVVSVLGVAFSAISFNRLLEERRRLADRVDLAGIAAERWLGAYVDQESGVRGYVLSGEPSFLQPYRRGQETAAREETNVRQRLAEEPELLRLADTFDRRATEWDTDIAAELIERTRRDGAARVSDGLLREGKAAFDQVRESYLRLAQRMSIARAEARDRLDQRTRELALVSVTSVGVLALGILGTWMMLNRWVLQPLADLGADARRVAGGDLDHQVPLTGAPEIAALSHEMESMRRRIVAEVTVVEAARERLERQAADLARSNLELEQFAYVASHDLQEPLRKISGFCQLLERRYAGQLDDRADEYIGFAVDGAKRMQRLINELLAFSRVGRSTTSFTAVDMAAVAAEATATLEGPLDASGGRVEVGELPTVWGDESLLEALVQNLVANALKFHGEDPPVVRLSAVRSSSDGGETGTPVVPGGTAGRDRRTGPGEMWLFTCADNGIGIEPEYAERVFVIFQRLHTRETYEGTGIGLAMCRKIVEFHGGRIWVEPPGTDGTDGGTTIRWTLPAGERKMPSTEPPLQQPARATAGSSNPPDPAGATA